MNLAPHVAVAVVAALLCIFAAMLSLETSSSRRTLKVVVPLLMIVGATVAAGIDLAIEAPQEALSPVGTVYLPINTTVTQVAVVNGTTTTTVAMVTATLVTKTYTYDSYGLSVCSTLLTVVIAVAALSAVLVMMVLFFESVRKAMEYSFPR